MTDALFSANADASEIRLGLEIAKHLHQDTSREAFLRAVFPPLLELIGGEGGGLVCQQDGQWRREAWFGQSEQIPELLIGEALDAAAPMIADRWYIAPLSGRQPQGNDSPTELANSLAVVVRLSDAEFDALHHASARQVQLTKTINVFVGAIQQIETRQYQQRRIEQLTAILQAAANWQQLDDDEALLRCIADTATDLLECERASIFLWDRRRKKLIGRPALGIDGSALEVDDDAGVVGEVLRTGEPKIWNSGSDDEARVNRKVDQTTDYETRSLVAVPMIGGHDDLIGVFEAINHHGGGFDSADTVVLDDLTIHAVAAIQSLRKRQYLTQTRDRLVNDAASSTPLIGDHQSIHDVRKRATKIAKTDLTILVLGQNGTGKEVVARHIHYESDRRSGPFVAVNCAALVETLLESELFGHEKGAFTDANQTRVGKFELATGGTLFLDEVGDMSLSGQAKLLRILEEKVVVRVGGSQTIPVDVRVIAATNQPLEELIEQRRFREDLFFRLNVVSLTLPPLSQRGDDVALLTEHFLQQFCYQIGRKVPTLQSSAWEALRRHHWPGNIRELRNTVERISYLCTGDSVTAEDLTLTGSVNESKLDADRSNFADILTDATKQFQIEHIERAIESSRGNMTDAAAMLGLHRSNLYRKMRQLGMQTTAD